MTEKLENFILNFSSFEKRSHTEKFVILGYFLTNIESKSVFTTANIMQLYSELDIAQPQNPSDLLSKGPFISTQNGYRLERTAKIDIEMQLGTPIRITVTKTLAELPDKLQNYDERQFLKEVINCYSMSAFRAAVVLCWSLSLYHLQQYIIKHRLSDFNKKLLVVAPAARIQSIKSMDDFSEIKEN